MKSQIQSSFKKRIVSYKDFNILGKNAKIVYATNGYIPLHFITDDGYILEYYSELCTGDKRHDPFHATNEPINYRL